jgi:hypothetical protein
MFLVNPAHLKKQSAVEELRQLWHGHVLDALELGQCHAVPWYKYEDARTKNGDMLWHICVPQDSALGDFFGSAIKDPGLIYAKAVGLKYCV